MSAIKTPVKFWYRLLVVFAFPCIICLFQADNWGGAWWIGFGVFGAAAAFCLYKAENAGGSSSGDSSGQV